MRNAISVFENVETKQKNAQNFNLNFFGLWSLNFFRSSVKTLLSFRNILSLKISNFRNTL